MTPFCPECYRPLWSGHEPHCSAARVLQATVCRVPGCHGHQDPRRRLRALCGYHGGIVDARLRRMAVSGEES